MDGNEAGGKDFETKNMELQHTEIKKQANKSKNEGWSSQWGLTDGETKAKHKDSACKIQGGKKEALKAPQRRRRRVKNEADKPERRNFIATSIYPFSIFVTGGKHPEIQVVLKTSKER